MTQPGSPSSIPRAARVAAALATNPAHLPAGDLLVDRARGMVGVEVQRRRRQVMHRVRALLVVVGQAWAQAVDLRAPAREGQVAEHVVKGPVLQHHDHNMVDLRQVGRRRWITPGVFHRSSLASRSQI
jgi:hypothetical protein